MTDPKSINTRHLSDAQFELAQTWWGMSFILQLASLLLGLYLVFGKAAALWSAVIPALCTITSYLCKWRSDRLKSTAEGIKRAVEQHDGFGWSITGKYRSDLLATASARARRKAQRPKNPDRYFASTKLPSPARTVENVAESAWWSHHLATEMGYVVAVAAIVVLGAVITILLAAVQSVAQQQTQEAVAKVVISGIVFLFSGGLIRLAVDSFTFAAGAGRVESHAEGLRQSDNIDQVAALRLLHEYQSLRQAAPLLLTVHWKVRQRWLNSVWEQERADNRESEDQASDRRP